MTRIFKSSQFEVHEQLGRGAFGVVYRGYDKVAKMDVAIKHVDLESSDEIEEIEQEIKMLSTCHNNYVTKYYGCFLKGFKLWIIMEYLGGGSCSDLLQAGPFSEPEIGLILYQLLQGLAYLHGNGKIHRDIKAANILVGTNGDVKIGDFGVATQLSNNLSKRNTFVGTPYWMAPEIIKHKEYTFTADIWSLGITAIELAYGRPPLSQFHPFDVLFKITDDPAPTLGSSFSADFNDFVNCCLQKDPQKRPSASELLEHKFIRKYADSNHESLVQLIQKKIKWNLDTGSTDRKYYVPSDKKNESGDAPFDIGTLTGGGNETISQESPKKSPQKGMEVVPPSHDILTSTDDSEKRHLRRKFNSILNQSFNKISEKFDLSTYEYDSLVHFETTLMKSLFLDDDHDYRLIFAKFFKLVLKRVMKSDDPELKAKILPKYYRNMEEKWGELLDKEHDNDSSKPSRDEVEELLLTRWGENMVDRN